MPHFTFHALLVISANAGFVDSIERTIVHSQNIFHFLGLR